MAREARLRGPPVPVLLRRARTPTCQTASSSGAGRSLDTGAAGRGVKFLRKGRSGTAVAPRFPDRLQIARTRLLALDLLCCSRFATGQSVKFCGPVERTHYGEIGS